MIIVGYILNDFTTHITILQIDDGKLYNFKPLNRIHFLKKLIIICFVNVETNLRLQYIQKTKIFPRKNHNF